MAQPKRNDDRVRIRLISMLPRLRRFAAVLAGERTSGDSLLRRACEKMMAESHAYRRGTPFDRWAFSELYALWLSELRGHKDPIARGRADPDLFRDALARIDETAADIEATAQVLASLPPQQRSALLLIYGEGLAYEEAAHILDTPEHTLIARAARGLTAFLDAAPSQKADETGAAVETLYQKAGQASR